MKKKKRKVFVIDTPGVSGNVKLDEALKIMKKSLQCTKN